jgi:hypothetical protein
MRKRGANFKGFRLKQIAIAFEKCWVQRCQFAIRNSNNEEMKRRYCELLNWAVEEGGYGLQEICGGFIRPNKSHADFIEACDKQGLIEKKILTKKY